VVQIRYKDNKYIDKQEIKYKNQLSRFQKKIFFHFFYSSYSDEVAWDV